MTGAIVASILAVLVIMVIVTRNSARVKREAREDLKREMEAMPHRDIMDLVLEEAAETGVDRIEGGDGIELPVRLQVWHRDTAVRTSCPDPELLRFVIEDGVAAEKATSEDVRLTFDGYVPAPEEPESEGAPVVEGGGDDQK